MRKRTRRVEVCFTEKEYSMLKKKAERAGRCVGVFIRKTMEGKEIRQAPPADVPYLLREMKRAGYNLNQTLKRANTLGIMDVPQLRRDMEEVRQAVRLVTQAYTGDS